MASNTPPNDQDPKDKNDTPEEAKVDETARIDEDDPVTATDTTSEGEAETVEAEIVDEPTASNGDETAADETPDGAVADEAADESAANDNSGGGLALPFALILGAIVVVGALVVLLNRTSDQDPQMTAESETGVFDVADTRPEVAQPLPRDPLGRPIEEAQTEAVEADAAETTTETEVAATDEETNATEEETVFAEAGESTEATDEQAAAETADADGSETAETLGYAPTAGEQAEQVVAEVDEADAAAETDTSAETDAAATTDDTASAEATETADATDASTDEAATDTASDETSQETALADVTEAAEETAAAAASTTGSAAKSTLLTMAEARNRQNSTDAAPAEADAQADANAQAETEGQQEADAQAEAQPSAPAQPITRNGMPIAQEDGADDTAETEVAEAEAETTPAASDDSAEARAQRAEERRLAAQEEGDAAETAAEADATDAETSATATAEADMATEEGTEATETAATETPEETMTADAAAADTAEEAAAPAMPAASETADATSAADAEADTQVSAASIDNIKSDVLKETEQVIDRRFEQTAQQVAAIRSEQQIANERLAALNKKIDIIQSSDLTQARQSTLLLALADLSERVNTGEPFGRELDNVEQISPDTRTLSQLRRYAEDGLPTVSDLQTRYQTAARAALSGAQREDAEGPVSRFAANVSSLFTVRKVGDIEGDTPTAIIARAEAHLESNNLEGAIEELKTLDGEARAAFDDWLADAEAKLDAQTRIDTLEQTINASRAG